MTSKTMTAALAAITLFGASAPAATVLAKGHGGGGHGGGGHGGGGHGGGGHFGGGGGFHGGGHGGRGYGHGGGLGAGLALGAVLGTYSGHPYYCRNHHNYRWNPSYRRYGYYYGGGGC